MNRWITVGLVISAMWFWGFAVAANAQSLPDDVQFDGNIQADVRDNGKFDGKNQQATATEDSVSIIGGNNIVANDGSKIDEVVFAVADAILEQVNIIGTTGANVDLHDFRADDIRDIHFYNNVGVQGANIASGNFNNQAIQNNLATAVSKPGFIDDARAMGFSSR